MSIKKQLSELKQADIAALLGKSERTIQLWHDKGLPRNGEGRGCTYVWADVLAWFLTSISQSRPEGGNLTDRERQQKADADVAEMERDQLAGSLVVAHEYQAQLEAMLSRLRANLMGFPSRLIDRLEGVTDPRERLAIGKREMEATLRELSSHLVEEEPAS